MLNSDNIAYALRGMMHLSSILAFSTAAYVHWVTRSMEPENATLSNGRTWPKAVVQKRNAWITADTGLFPTPVILRIWAVSGNSAIWVI